MLNGFRKVWLRHKWFRRCLRSLGFIIGFFVLYFLMVVFGTLIPVNTDFEQDPEGIKIYVESNGVHTDIVVPIHHELINWENTVDPKDFDPPDEIFKYIAFGWGDKGFYLYTPNWDDLKASTAIKATLLPSPTAMHVTYKEEAPIAGERSRELLISSESYQSLINYILSSFKFENEKTQLIDCCRYGNVNDNFYEANGSYHLFRTCNNWTNGALKEARVKTSLWAPFSDCVFFYLAE